MLNGLLRTLLPVFTFFSAWAADNLDSDLRAQIVTRGAHEQRVEYVTRLTGDAGTELFETNSYVQLQTGLNRWDETLETYVPASAAIELVNGHPTIRNAQYQAVFAQNANSPEGLIDLYMPGGERLSTQPMGVAVTESDTGRSVFLGELQESKAILVDENTIVYPDAFDLFKGAIVIRSRLNGIESDVLLQERVDEGLLAELGVNPSTARLEVWHRVLRKPEARADKKPLSRMGGKVESDVTIHFPQMAIDSGTAFLMEENGLALEEQIRVGKEWVTLEGNDFLIESVPFAEAKPRLKTLPAREEARLIDKQRLERAFAAARATIEVTEKTTVKQFGGRNVERPVRSGKPLSIAAYARRSAERKSTAAIASEQSKLLAQAALESGFLIDFPVTLTTQTDFTFKGDTTYWVTGAVDLYGTTILEGGAVIKYTNYTANSPVVTVRGSFDCRTSPYNVAFFTAEDDDTVGEKIASSTGTPLTGTFYSWFNLRFVTAATNALSVHDVHSRYSHSALRFEVPVEATIWNITAYNCDRGIETTQSDLIVRNALINKTRYAFTSGGLLAKAIRTEHLTVNTARQLFYDPAGNNALFLTNSLLCTITNSPTVGVTSNTTYSVTSSAFVSVGRGNHYLSNNTYRNIGNQDIGSETKAILGKTTTYPPVEVTSAITGETSWLPVVERDTGIPDLGYHYTPLDYCLSALSVTANLNLGGGVAVGVYGAKGLVLNTGSKFVSEGTPMRMNRLVRYSSVQEDSSSRWGAAPSGGLLEMGSSGKEIRLRFTAVSLPSGNIYSRQLLGNFDFQSYIVTPLAISDSNLRGVSQIFRSHQSGSTIAITNNVFERSSISLRQGVEQIYTFAGFTAYLYNNLFNGGTVAFLKNSSVTSWVVKDNLFASESVGVGTVNVTASNNGYCSGLTSLGGSGNVTGIIADYVSGPLGFNYYPSSGGNLSLLINAGSRNATNAGLAYFTTSATYGTSEGSSTVDIGFHYVGVDSNGNVVDSDSDGLPDYWESGWFGHLNSDAYRDSDADGLTNLEEYLQGTNPGSFGFQVFTPLQP